MIAVDTNLLLIAHRREAPGHEAALRVMRRLATHAAWGLPWIVAAEFYAVATNPRLWRRPRPDDALGALDAWIGTAGARLLGETPDMWPSLSALVRQGGVLGGRVHDARIAAVCLAHGVTELWTLDRDFSWFPELRTRNPLVG